MKKFKTKKSRRVNNAIYSIFNTLDYNIEITIKNAKNNVWSDEESYRRYLKNEVIDNGRISKANIFGIQLIDGITYEEFRKVYTVRIDRKIEDAINKIDNIKF